MNPRLARAANLLLLVAGVGLLALIVVRLDAAQVMRRIAQVGWIFPVALGVFVGGIVLTASAWRTIIDPGASRASFGRLLATFWAGYSINAVTPTASLGEVYRATRIRGHVDADEAVASLIVLHFLNTLLGQLATLIGPTACLLALDLPDERRAALIAVLIAAILCCVPLGLLYLLIRIGAAHQLLRLLTHLPLLRFKDPEALLARARGIDDRVRVFRRARPRSFRRALAQLVAVKVTQAGELLIILGALLPDQGMGRLVLLALLLQSATQVVAWVLSFVPGQVGVLEGAAALLFGALGLDATVALSVQLVRRARALIAIGLGLLVGLATGHDREVK